MKKKLVYFLIACMIGTLVLTAGVSQVLGAKRTEVEFVTWGPSPLVDEYFEGRVVAFEKLHPEIKANYHSFGDYQNKLIILYAAGETPDVISTHTLIHDAFMYRNMFLALDSYIDGPNGLPRDDFPTSGWNALSMKGVTYGIPQTTGGLGLMYNRDLFDKAGMAYPNESWTWDDLKEAAEKLTIKKGNRVVQYGFTQDWISWCLIDAIYKAGGTIWNKDKTAAALNSEEVKNVLSFWKELIDNDFAAGPKIVGTAATEAMKLFAMGRAAMMIGGTWQVMSAKAMSPDLNYAVTLAPQGKTKINVVFDTNYAISNQTKVGDEAWTLAKFLLSPDGLLETWRSLYNSLPARYSCFKMEGFKEPKGIPGYIPPVTEKEFEEILSWEIKAFQKDTTSTEYSSAFAINFMVYSSKMLQEIFIKGTPVEQALDSCVAEINKAIERGL